MAIDYATPLGQVRLLIADVDDTRFVFTDDQVTAFLAMNAGQVKLAAAAALDTIATDEALASKVIRTQDLQTDGAKLADSLGKRAAALRQQHLDEIEDGGAFEIVEFGFRCGPERTS